jgi:glycosyltransferase involved in cell wall biosynthesis
VRKPGVLKRALFDPLYYFTTTFLGWPKMGVYRFKRQMNLFFLLKGLPKPDSLIAVDSSSAWVAQKFKLPVHFLSLEIVENDVFRRSINNRFASIIIQSAERYHYYFPENDVKVFYVQNAPVYRELTQKFERKGLIYNGTAQVEFGVFYCIEFIAKYPQFILTMKGGVPERIKHVIESRYQSLLQDGRLVINKEYIDTKELTLYLSRFRIGFCFYDTSIEKINTFNYHTAPSGKLFSYLASGTPVIVNNIRGLNVVNEFRCGIMIDNMDPESIYSAVLEIEKDYETFSNNCIKAAKHYSFDKNIAPFIEFLKTV